MRKLHLLAIVALIMTGLSGCEKATVQNEATGDVFIKSIKNTAGVTVYTAIHSVFSYNKMTSVSVKTPDSTTIQLKNYENGGNSFYNEPVDADYLATLPTAGPYVYSVTFSNDEAKTYTNTLASASLLPAVITSLAKTANGDSIYISWNAIANTQAYQLKVMKGTVMAYFQGAFQDGSVPLKANLRLGIPSTAFSNTGAGTYTFELSGLLFETSAYDYIQAISTATKDIAL